MQYFYYNIQMHDMIYDDLIYALDKATQHNTAQHNITIE